MKEKKKKEASVTEPASVADARIAELEYALEVIRITTTRINPPDAITNAQVADIQSRIRWIREGK